MYLHHIHRTERMFSILWTVKQRQAVDQNKLKCSWIKKLQPEHFQNIGILFLLPSLYASVCVWEWMCLDEKRGTRCFWSGLEICIQLLDQSHISLQTKLTGGGFLQATVTRHIQETHFIAISIFAWSFFHYRNTFTSFMGLLFFSLFDMLPHQRNSNEKRKQTEISIFSFSPEGIEEYIWIIFSTEMTNPK